MSSAFTFTTAAAIILAVAQGNQNMKTENSHKFDSSYLIGRVLVDTFL